jgi:hypothetical protein
VEGFVAEAVVDESDVKAELPGITRIELRGLELDHDIAELPYVEEQQVDEEVIPVDVE